jgi:hypothetical protein
MNRSAMEHHTELRKPRQPGPLWESPSLLLRDSGCMICEWRFLHVFRYSNQSHLLSCSLYALTILPLNKPNKNVIEGHFLAIALQK